ncbi:AraC family transcriptional regulator [Paenibacillus sp. Sa2BVA9]|uniref:AraC family transcriptional regulator n=1 Tax=Paenibacillus gallinarum TaxID=2762232 RepID=A0ABR8T670_9BACL|nr:AraC family transcriptional regulator [Paenibacillus gallinarum]
MNPSHYLQRLRLLKGAELLSEHSELSVGELARMVGMDLKYFVRIFKREHGITPAKYRSRFSTL